MVGRDLFQTYGRQSLLFVTILGDVGRTGIIILQLRLVEVGMGSRSDRKFDDTNSQRRRTTAGKDEKII